jgi:sugar phosphate isomerase/epimerase
MKLALAVQTPEVQPAIPVALLSGTWEEKLDKAAALGVGGLELMTTDPVALDARAIRAELSRRRLVAAAVGSGAVAFATGLTLLHSDVGKAELARERLRQLIGFAAEVGAPLVTVGSFRGRLAKLGQGARAELATVLREGAVYAQERSVRLALEPLNRYESDVVNTVEQGLAFLDEVGHPGLGLVVDTYHVNIEERSWTEPFRRAMAAGKLWHVHLGDNNRLPPGQGLVDFRAIVGTLREIGYNQFLSAELLARPDPDAAAWATVAAMGPLLLEV